MENLFGDEYQEDGIHFFDFGGAGINSRMVPCILAYQIESVHGECPICTDGKIDNEKLKKFKTKKGY